MTGTDFQHLNLSMVKDVALVEISTKDLQGLHPSQELANELALVTAQDWAQRVLIDFRRVGYLGSTGFAAILQLLDRAAAGGREVKLCSLGPGVLLGAEIAGLPKVVEIHNDQATALRAFVAPKA